MSALSVFSSTAAAVSLVEHALEAARTHEAGHHGALHDLLDVAGDCAVVAAEAAVIAGDAAVVAGTWAASVGVAAAAAGVTVATGIAVAAGATAAAPALGAGMALAALLPAAAQGTAALTGAAGQALLDARPRLAEALQEGIARLDEQRGAPPHNPLLLPEPLRSMISTATLV